MQLNPTRWLHEFLLPWIGNNLGSVLLGALVLIVVAWLYEAVDEAEDSFEAAQGFAGRAKSGTGVLNVALVSLVALVGWAGTTFQTVGEATAFLLTLAPNFPMLSASIATISLGALGLTDLIILKAWHFIGISLTIVLLALAYRTNFNRVRLP